MADDAPHVERPMAPTTTAQEDLTTLGQRRVNLIWEVTQSLLASVVTMTGMSMCVVVVWRGSAIPELLSMSVGLIIGFYFGRTNHAAIGGTGRKPAEAAYEGR